MNVTIGTAPCSWGVWYADGTPSGTPYRTFLDQAAAAGYKALELGPVGYLPADPSKLINELEERSLYVCAGTACYAFDRVGSLAGLLEELDGLCGLLVRLKAPFLVAMDGSEVGLFSEKKKCMPREKRLKSIETVRDMAKYTAEEYGIKTVFHPHVKSLFEYEEEIIELMDYAKVDLCFDTGHHAYCNGGWERGDRSALDFMLKYSERIAYLHFKNVDGSIRKRVADEGIDPDTAFDINVMCDLEKGIIDFTDLKKVMDKIGFDGIGIIEQDMPRAASEQAYDSARRNLEYLRRINMLA